MDIGNKELWPLGSGLWGTQGGGPRAVLGLPCTPQLSLGAIHVLAGRFSWKAGVVPPVAPRTGYRKCRLHQLFPKIFPQHSRNSAFGARIGPGNQELAVPGYKTRNVSDTGKENQIWRRRCLPGHTLLAAKHKGVQWWQGNWTMRSSRKDPRKQRAVADNHIAPIITNLRYINIIGFLPSICAIIL